MASRQVRGTSVRCRQSLVAPPPAPLVPDIPPEMERMTRLRTRTNSVDTSEACPVALRTPAGGSLPTTAAPADPGPARAPRGPQSTGLRPALQPTPQPS